ncbi:MAG: hypothetical protein ACRCUY_14185 [Thermoguttaceae bacterium]
MTVYFSHRGTEDTEKRQQILREPCASVREKKFQPFNNSRKGGAKHRIDGLFFAQRHGAHGEAGTNPP